MEYRRRPPRCQAELAVSHRGAYISRDSHIGRRVSPLLAILEAELHDRYRIERELGAGGMALVWLATDLRHGRSVALKVLRPELALSGIADRFLREARVLADLQHPHILPLLDSGVIPLTPGGERLCPFYVMPLVRGESLRERLTREGQLSLDDGNAIAAQVAGALDYAHKRGVVHRDVKPENLLLADDQVYLADFGIAAAVEEAGGARLTETGLTLGTPAYMSPEQAAAERRVDGRSDQYSLACVVFEMLAGEPPFSGPTAQAIMAKRLSGPAPSIGVLRPSLPSHVPVALARALAQLPADRFPSAGAFAAALTPAKGGDERPVRPVSPGTRWPVMLATALLVITSAALILRSRRPAVPAALAHDSTTLELRARADMGYAKRTQAGTTDAVQLYSQSIARDSGYAQSWNGLAQAYVRAYIWGFTIPDVPRDSLLTRALRASDGAFVADSNLAMTWVTRAIVMRQLAPTSRTDVFRALRRALQLDPNDAEAWNEYAQALADSDSLSASLDARRHAVRIRPSYTEAVQFLALGHMWSGNYDSAIAWADSAIALNPTNVLNRLAAGWIALARGDGALAEREFAAADKMGGGTERAGALAGLAMAHAAEGDSGQARRILMSADSVVGRGPDYPVHSVVYLAEAWDAVGNRDRALKWLHQYPLAADLHFQLHLRHDPAFAPLRGDRQFQALMGSGQ